MKFKFPENTGSPSIIKVLGVGGGGSNAVNHMFRQGIVGVDFAVSNTDIQVLDVSPVPTRIQLGPDLTEGRGAGSKPLIGREACVESLEEVKRFFADGTKMLFITAGMGGGTGTGAAPVIAKAAQEMDILTVAIVTLPFAFEGKLRLQYANEGLAELKKNVDTIIVISNDKLRQMHGNLSLSQAFAQADNVLTTAAKGIAEIITVAGYVNVDFEDVNTVMRGSGVAVMGTATTEGPDRARRAVETALQSPLLEDNDIRGAQHILLNISSGKQEVTMDEIWEITEFIQDEAGDANLIWGNSFDESLGEKLSVTIIATGFEAGRKKTVSEGRNTRQESAPVAPPRKEQVRVSLDDEPRAKVQEKKPANPYNLYDLSGPEVENKVSIEFEGESLQPKHTFNKPPGYEKQEPFLREGAEKRTMEKPRNDTGRAKLRDMSMQFNNPNYVNELENEPAYLRKKVNLDDVPHSSENSMSKWSLGINDDDEPEFRENNRFLHDNVD